MGDTVKEGSRTFLKGTQMLRKWLAALVAVAFAITTVAFAAD
jgi:hypothetical protein